jgi:hypothetical protein
VRKLTARSAKLQVDAVFCKRTSENPSSRRLVNRGKEVVQFS